MTPEQTRELQLLHARLSDARAMLRKSRSDSDSNRSNADTVSHSFAIGWVQSSLDGACETLDGLIEPLEFRGAA